MNKFISIIAKRLKRFKRAHLPCHESLLSVPVNLPEQEPELTEGQRLKAIRLATPAATADFWIECLESELSPDDAALHWQSRNRKWYVVYANRRELDTVITADSPSQAAFKLACKHYPIFGGVLVHEGDHGEGLAYSGDTLNSYFTAMVSEVTAIPTIDEILEANGRNSDD